MGIYETHVVHIAQEAAPPLGIQYHNIARPCTFVACLTPTSDVSCLYLHCVIK